MWFIESQGFRIGPKWYTEAGPFATREIAETYLAEHRQELSPQGRELRVNLDDSDCSKGA